MEGRVIQVNEGELKKHVSEIVRESVEGTLNSLLEAEADSLCQARRYERNAERASTWAGHYTRSLQTTSGAPHGCSGDGIMRMPRRPLIPARMEQGESEYPAPPCVPAPAAWAWRDATARWRCRGR
ncbi:MAG: transposase [Desulfovibrionaceae bacterium]